MVTTLLLHLRLEPVNVYRVDLAVARRPARRAYLEGK